MLGNTISPRGIQWAQEYGICFRFNSSKDESGRPKILTKITHPGIHSGLEIQMFVGSNKNFISRLNNDRMVFINESTIYPLNYESTDTNVGQLTNIVIRKRAYRRIMYSDCHFSGKLNSGLISETAH